MLVQVPVQPLPTKDARTRPFKEPGALAPALTDPPDPRLHT